MGDDFTNLWKSKQSSDKGNNQQKSIISGLRKLLQEKDLEVTNLKQENKDLKQKLNNDLEILEKTEKVISELKEENEGYKEKLGEDKGPADEQIRNLKMKMKSLEDKLYVFSSLPDRIATLEEQKVKDNELIDQLEERERKLMKKIKAITSDSSSGIVIEKMEAQINKQKKQLELYKNQIQELENNALSPASLSDTKSSSMNASASEVLEWKDKFEKAKSQYEKILNDFNIFKQEHDETEKELLKLKAESSSGISDQKLEKIKEQYAKMKSALSKYKLENEDLKQKLQQSHDSDKVMEKYFDLQSENKKLKTTIESLNEKLKKADINYENLLQKYQEIGKSSAIHQELLDLQQKLKNSQQQIPNLKNKVQELDQELIKKDNKIQSLQNQINEMNQETNKPINELVSDLQAKVERQNKIIAKLKKDSISTPPKPNLPPKPVLPPKPSQTIPQVDSGEIERLKNQINTLKKENNKLKEDLARPQAAAGQENLISLVDDLQRKITRLKKQNMSLKKELGK